MDTADFAVTLFVISGNEVQRSFIQITFVLSFVSVFVTSDEDDDVTFLLTILQSVLHSVETGRVAQSRRALQ